MTLVSTKWDIILSWEKQKQISVFIFRHFLNALKHSCTFIAFFENSMNLLDAIKTVYFIFKCHFKLIYFIINDINI